MNGILIISMESGMLLHSDSYAENFGLQSQVQPLQLSSILYAVYSLAHEMEDQYEPDLADIDVANGDYITNLRKSPVAFFRQGDVMWHYHECNDSDVGMLVLLSMDPIIRHSRASELAEELAQVQTPSDVHIYAELCQQVYLSHKLPTCQSPRAAVVRQLRAEMWSVIDAKISDMAAALMQGPLPEDIWALGMCHAKRIEDVPLKDSGKLSSENSTHSSRILSEWIALESSGPVDSATAPIATSGERNAPDAKTSYVSSAVAHSRSADNLGAVQTNEVSSQPRRPGTAGVQQAEGSSEGDAPVQSQRRRKRGPFSSAWRWIKKRLEIKSDNIDLDAGASPIPAGDAGHAEEGNAAADNLPREDHMSAYYSHAGEGVAASVAGSVDRRSMQWQVFYAPSAGIGDETLRPGAPLIGRFCENTESPPPVLEHDFMANLPSSSPHLRKSDSFPSPAKCIFPLKDSHMYLLLSQMMAINDGVRDFNIATMCSEFGINPIVDVTSPEDKAILTVLHGSQRPLSLSREKDQSIILHVSEFESASIDCSSATSSLRDRMRSSDVGTIFRQSTKDSLGGSFNADDFVRVDWLQLSQDGLFLTMFLRTSFEDGGEEEDSHSLTALIRSDTEDGQSLREMVALSKSSLAKM